MRKVGTVKKSRQHHVWQQYLRAWSVDGLVYCLQDGRIFHTGTPALGVANDFYKVGALTDEDLGLLHLLAGLEKTHPVVRQHHEMVLENILTPMLFVKKYRNSLQDIDKVDEILDEHNTNAVDNQHTVIEAKFAPLLARTLRGDVSWYEDDAECINFCNFVAAQHMRTQGVKNRTIARLKDRMGLDASRIWDVLALILGFNLGCSLFLERRSRKLTLVRNDTEIPFITSDQPVINILSDGEAAPEALSLYYPMSPTLALYMEQPNEVEKLPFETMTGEAVMFLNAKIATASHRQAYGHVPEPLQAVLLTRAKFG